MCVVFRASQKAEARTNAWETKRRTNGEHAAHSSKNCVKMYKDNTTRRVSVCYKPNTQHTDVNSANKNNTSASANTRDPGGPSQRTAQSADIQI